MMINLSDVLSEQHKSIEESVSIEMNQFESGSGTFPIIEKSPLSLCIRYAGDRKLEIDGEAEVTALIPCDRCLKDVEVKIPLVFHKKVTTDSEDAGQADDLDETNYIDGYNLDVEQLIYNELLVGWPTKILCSESCKGICHVCGQNLNEGTCNCEDTGLDPRMSVIRDVFKNFKEV
jgi:uncharacterized protein